MPVNLNAQRSDNYGNQNTNAASANVTWVWQVGDKCMAKYWEDNRVRIVFSYYCTLARIVKNMKLVPTTHMNFIVLQCRGHWCFRKDLCSAI